MTIRRTRIFREADWHRIKGQNGIGTKVCAVVLRHVGFGALCSIGNGRIPAIIRKVEIAWDPAAQTNAQIPEGQSFNALVIGHDDDWRELIISRKAVDPSPFAKFIAQHTVGSIVEATIVRKSMGAWIVRIGGGLSAKIEFSAVPQVPSHPVALTVPLELKIGDQLKASICKIDHENQEVFLDVCAAVDRIERRNQFKLDHWRRFDRHRPQRSPILPTSIVRARSQVQKPLNILIVDDEPNIVNAVYGVLKNRCHHVTAASSVQAAEFVYVIEKLDVAVVDLQLAGDSGIVIIKELLEKFPTIRIIVFSARAADIYKTEYRSRVEAIDKPAPLDWLIAAIEGTGTQSKRTLFSDLDVEVEQLSQVREGAPDKETDLSNLFGNYVSSFGEAFPDAAFAILRFHRATNEIVCLRASNIDRHHFDAFSAKLRFTKLGDALEDIGFCHISDSTSNSSDDTLARLMRQARVSRIYGRRLKIDVFTDPIGVFALFPLKSKEPQPDAIRRFHLQTDALALAINRSAWDAAVVRQQRAQSASSMMLGMTHEFKNSVTGLIFRATALQLAVDAKNSEPERQLAHCREAAIAIRKQLGDLADAFDSLLRLSRVGEENCRPISEIVDEIVEQCRATAEQDHVTLIVDKQDIPLEVSSYHVSPTLAQVVLNLVLNGIQHTQAFRKADGIVEVKLEKEREEEADWLAIRVIDNAFGIDWVNRERIFDLFRTTRRDGSGLGLYVSRLIVEGLGGQISVEESFKFLGSTMLVRLPMK